MSDKYCSGVVRLSDLEKMVQDIKKEGCKDYVEITYMDCDESDPDNILPACFLFEINDPYCSLGLISMEGIDIIADRLPVGDEDY